MKKVYKENGITLTSLVITVVVLMIFSVVFIGINEKDNDALNLARDKKAETEQLSIEEEIKNQLSENPPQNYEQLIGILKNFGQVRDEENIEKAVLQTTKGGYEIKVSNIWNMDAKNAGLKVGDYVAYNVETSQYISDGKYTGTGERAIYSVFSGDEIKWRVFYVDEIKNEIAIIPENLSTYMLTLEGENGYNNAVKILNDIADTLFSNEDYKASARALNIEDIQKITNNIGSLRGDNYASKKMYEGVYYPNIVTQNISNSSQIELFMGSSLANRIETTNSFYQGNLELDDIYKELLPNQTFWLASRAISNNENGISYYISTLDVENNVIIGGSKLFDSDQTRYSETHALLPVVTISRNIQIISGEGKSDNPYKLEQ